jgi:hypothetical protein
MNLKEVGWCGVEWSQLAQDRDQWQARECSDESLGSGFRELLEVNLILVIHVFHLVMAQYCYTVLAFCLDTKKQAASTLGLTGSQDNAGSSPNKMLAL